MAFYDLVSTTGLRPFQLSNRISLIFIYFPLVEEVPDIPFPLFPYHLKLMSTFDS